MSFRKNERLFPTLARHNGYRTFGRVYSDMPNLIHQGHDFGQNVGDGVLAIDDGVVIFKGLVKGFKSLPSRNDVTGGGVLCIRHGDITALYGHLDILKDIQVGNKVQKGRLLGSINDFRNGGVLLPHLHFSIWDGEGVPPTPWGYVPSLEVKDSSGKVIGNWINPIRYLELGEK